MNFNNIAENIVATLIVTVIIGIITSTVRILSSKFKKDKLGFIITISFYVDFFVTVFTCILTNPNELFSGFSLVSFFNAIFIVLDIFFTIMAHHNVKKYAYRTPQKHEN